MILVHGLSLFQQDLLSEEEACHLLVLYFESEKKILVFYVKPPVPLHYTGVNYVLVNFLTTKKQKTEFSFADL